MRTQSENLYMKKVQIRHHNELVSRLTEEGLFSGENSFYGKSRSGKDSALKNKQMTMQLVTLDRVKISEGKCGPIYLEVTKYMEVEVEEEIPIFVSEYLDF